MFGDFIRETSNDPFVWGQNDCAIWSANAVLVKTGVDPAAPFRGTYSSRFECRQMIMRAGGLLRLIQPQMTGFMPFNQHGVGVLKIGKQTMCGLLTGGRAVVRKESGIAFVDSFQILEAWSWSR